MEIDALLGGPGGDRPSSEAEWRRAAERLAGINRTLLGFFLDMTRGMQEFRRANDLASAENATAGIDALSVEELAGRLVAPGSDAERRDLDAGVQELKVHHAALLEGYHEATHAGARRILERLAPEELKRELSGSKVRIGPLQVSATSRPVVVAAIWEEFLRRHRDLSALEAGDLERFFRDGFRQGYWRFREARLARTKTSDDPAARDAATGGSSG